MTPQEKQILDMTRMLKQHSALLSVAIKKITILEKSVSSLERDLETVKRDVKKIK
jgi:hypothetical protein